MYAETSPSDGTTNTSSDISHCYRSSDKCDRVLSRQSILLCKCHWRSKVLPEWIKMRGPVPIIAISLLHIINGSRMKPHILNLSIILQNLTDTLNSVVHAHAPLPVLTNALNPSVGTVALSASPVEQVAAALKSSRLPQSTSPPQRLPTAVAASSLAQPMREADVAPMARHVRPWLAVFIVLLEAVTQHA